MNKPDSFEEFKKSDVPADTLEILRNRLQQVHQSLRKLAEQIAHSNRNNRNKLPPYLTLHGQFQVLITQLQSIASQLETNLDILKSTNAYPLPSFPTTQQEGLVTTLLRKKPLPEVEDWIDEAIKESETFDLPILKDDEFAEWCHAKVKYLETQFNFEGFYNDGDVPEPEDPSRKKSSKSPMAPGIVMKFMTRGTLD